MDNVVFQRHTYKIIKVSKDGYIVTNTRRSFEEGDGHTHNGNFHFCRLLITCALLKGVPKKDQHLKKNQRFLESMCRICDNKDLALWEGMLSKVLNDNEYNHKDHVAETRLKKHKDEKILNKGEIDTLCKSEIEEDIIVK